jgi:hypothetical protein
MILLPGNVKRMGFGYDLINKPSITLLKFAIMPPWDFITIGKKLSDLSLEV